MRHIVGYTYNATVIDGVVFRTHLLGISLRHSAGKLIFVHGPPILNLMELLNERRLINKGFLIEQRLDHTKELT